MKKSILILAASLLIGTLATTSCKKVDNLTPVERPVSAQTTATMDVVTYMVDIENHPSFVGDYFKQVSYLSVNSDTIFLTSQGQFATDFKGSYNYTANSLDSLFNLSLDSLNQYAVNIHPASPVPSAKTFTYSTNSNNFLELHDRQGGVDRLITKISLNATGLNGNPISNGNAHAVYKYTGLPGEANTFTLLVLK